MMRCCRIKGGLSHEMDLDFDAMWWPVFSSRGRRRFLKFLGALMILWCKKCIFRGLFEMRWFNSVTGMYLVKVSLLLIGSDGFGTFLQVSALASHGWRIVQILRQCRRKRNNTAPTTLSAIQASSQSIFINAQFYSTCDCKQLTLLSQRKLA